MDKLIDILHARVVYDAILTQWCVILHSVLCGMHR